MATPAQRRNRVQKRVGQAKETVGKLTGNRSLELKGKVERAKGSVKETVEAMKATEKKR